MATTEAAPKATGSLTPEEEAAAIISKHGIVAAAHEAIRRMLKVGAPHEPTRRFSEAIFNRIATKMENKKTKF